MIDINKTTRAELAALVMKERVAKEEVIADIKQIIEAAQKLLASTDIPNKITFMWVLSNYKAVLDFVKTVINVIKTKNYVK